MVARRWAMSVLPAVRRQRWLIGVTTNISTDIAAVPFLWIVPLTVYLATLILAYLRPGADRTVARTVALPILALLAGLLGRSESSSRSGRRSVSVLRDARRRRSCAPRPTRRRPTDAGLP